MFKPDCHPTCSSVTLTSCNTFPAPKPQTAAGFDLYSICVACPVRTDTLKARRYVQHSGDEAYDCTSRVCLTQYDNDHLTVQRELLQMHHVLWTHQVHEVRFT